MRICLYLIIVFFFHANYLVAQTCKPSSIPASTPDSQLQDNGNGTVSDLKSGLMWKKCAEGLSGNNCSSGSLLAFNWKMALEQPGIVNAAGFSGFNDWRLPNFKELNSIVEKQCYDPAINVSHFPNTPGSSFWSGSASAYYSSYAWYVVFNNGYSYNTNRSYSYSVRLVRGGQ